MKINIIVCFVILIMGCNAFNADLVYPSVDINNSILKNSIDDYLQELPDNSNEENVTLYFETLKDTTSIILINLPPDTTTKIKGLANSGKYKLFFTGQTEFSNLVTIDSNTTSKLKKGLKAPNNTLDNIKHVEPMVLRLYFLKDSLVKYY